MNRLMLVCRRRTFALALLLVLCSTSLPRSAWSMQVKIHPSQKGAMPRTQKHESHHEIDLLEETWRTAVLKGDSVALSSLLADDFIAISANGTVHTKEETLAKLGGKKHYLSMEFSDRKVRFYGATALVTSRAEVVAATAGGEVTGSYRYTRVYVRNPKGEWKVVSFEASRIAQHHERK